jgi:hypothetical protein
VGSVTPSAEVPNDGIDNDCNGKVDQALPGTPPVVEVCGNGIDDDQDGLVDCADPECANREGCKPGTENCSNGMDDDKDGLVDCADPECANSEGCKPGTENCGNGMDDDKDGLVDCADPECAISTSCQGKTEECGNGQDDDLDGLVDCQDPDCNCNVAGCVASTKIAFVSCDPQVNFQPGPHQIDKFACDQVNASTLASYDTIIYFGDDYMGTGWDLVEQRLNAGAKVILFGKPYMKTLPGMLTVHEHHLVLNDPATTITATGVNTMTNAFNKANYPGMEMLQMHTDSQDWCGDLFFENFMDAGGTPFKVYDGHFHGVYRDDAMRKGILIYIGLNFYTTKSVNFGDAFLAAHLQQKWDPSAGLSAACGLPCSKPVGHGQGKPVIYLYPRKEQRVSVRLDFEGQLVNTYPPINEAKSGWDVIAKPDGSLINLEDKQPYSYLYWSGVSGSYHPDWSTGFVVPGKDTVKFLQKTLSAMGLKPAEYNEMIVYWAPHMQHHAYNLVHFAGNEYTDIAKMRITPKPDSMLRVYMAFKELKAPVQVAPQKIVPFVRKGFAVVEWGGAEIGGEWHVAH